MSPVIDAGLGVGGRIRENRRIVIRASSSCFKVVLKENISRSVNDSYVVHSEAFLAVPGGVPSVVRGELVTVYNEPDVDLALIQE